MDMRLFETTISGIKTKVIHLVPSLDTQIVVLRTHHILLIDRSGSMYSSLSTLIDHVQSAIDAIGDNDIISVGWFSGENQYDFIVRGARKSEEIKRMLDRYRSTVGMTVFNQVIDKTVNVTADFASQVDQTSVTLFTDGQSTMNLGSSEDLRRSLQSVEALNMSSLLAFNTVGYGHYYDRNFLQTLSSYSQYGEFIHSAQIDQVMGIFHNKIESAQGFTARTLQVDTSTSDILHISADVVNLSQSDYYVNRLSKSRNDVYIIVHDSSDELNINGDEYTVKDAKKVSISSIPDVVENFFYAYADQLYYNGNTQKALDIIVNNCKDKYLADKMMNAFTSDERGQVQEALRLATFDYNYRLIEGKTPPKYMPAKNALCVMDVFDILFQSGTAKYVPFSKNVPAYEKIGRSVVDQQNAFTRSSEEVLELVDEFIWNKEKLNLSLSFKIQGSVELNKKSADREGLQSPYPAFIYRTHTFIKDGNLNIRQAEFEIDNNTRSALTSMKVPFTDTDNNRVVINFSKLPVINRTYIDKSASVSHLAEMVVQSHKIEASLKVLKDVKEKILDKNVNLNKTGAYKALTAAQIQVLEDHGIRKDGTYGGIANVQAKAEDSDKYEVRTLYFYQKGISSLPSMNDFNQMVAGSKKVNTGGQYMLDAYKQYMKDFDSHNFSLDKPTTEFRDYVEKLIRELKSKLNENRLQINSVKLAKVLTHDWFSDLERDDKGAEYFTLQSGEVVILRSDYTYEYIDAKQEAA